MKRINQQKSVSKKSIINCLINFYNLDTNATETIISLDILQKKTNKTIILYQLTVKVNFSFAIMQQVELSLRHQKKTEEWFPLNFWINFYNL